MQVEPKDGESARSQSRARQEQKWQSGKARQDVWISEALEGN